MAADSHPSRNQPPFSKRRPSLRREGREAALQFLFSHDLNPSMKPEGPAAVAFWNLRTAKPRVRDFATELITGLLPHLAEIDEKITAATENYAFSRLAAVDRNLLRLAVYEILFREDIPAPVSINEAVEIAKDFGTDESPKFVNGILDRIHKDAAAAKS